MVQVAPAALLEGVRRLAVVAEPAAVGTGEGHLDGLGETGLAAAVASGDHGQARPGREFDGAGRADAAETLHGDGRQHGPLPKGGGGGGRARAGARGGQRVGDQRPYGVVQPRGVQPSGDLREEVVGGAFLGGTGLLRGTGADRVLCRDDHGQATFFQVRQPWVLKISPLWTVTRPLPLRLSLAMIESNSPLESLSRSQ